jgi:catechol 2,3-dioxygenase-like lactoylglutathione lyase family enzyme
MGLDANRVDHIDVHASDYAASVQFYEAILAPLGIPRIARTNEATCFTNVNVVDRVPPTTHLHLCFHARSREQVDAFHAAGVAAGFVQTARRATASISRGTTPPIFSIRTATTSRRSIETSVAQATASAIGKTGVGRHHGVSRTPNPEDPL